MKKVLALGFFDSIHIGHRALIAEAQEIANKTGAQLCVSTFDDAFFDQLKKNEIKEIYTLKERRMLLAELGVPCIRVFESTQERFAQSGIDFFRELVGAGDVTDIVCGEDYTFGCGASCNCTDLKRFCEESGISLHTAKTFMTEDGNKVSSRAIRRLLSEGNIPEANRLLGKEYFCAGAVVHGRGDGSKFGIPTANLDIMREKLLPAYGVYQTVTEAEGVRYRSLTNVGGQPTFDMDKPTIETLILDYSGNLYGKEITVIFSKKIREIVRFANAAALRRQIEKDIEEVLRD